jgi:predicted CoA-binding protein
MPKPMRTIEEILRQSRTIAVVGLSSDPMRPSYGIAKALQSYGYRVIPVNPKESEVLGEKSYGSLREIPEAVDLVNVFRRPEQTPTVAHDAVAIGAKALWLQSGIENDEAERIATAGGLDVVMDRCIMVEHRKQGL